MKGFFGFGKKRNAQIISDDFTEEVQAIIKQAASGEIEPLTIDDLYSDGEIRTAGIAFKAAEEQADEIVADLQAKIKPLGYLAFIKERSFSQNGKSKIGVIKGIDQFELLSIVQTNGDNYDISNEEVIAKLKEWNKRYPFTITGADYDWMEARFAALPAGHELESFAEEVYEFCPDIVDQGAGSIEALIEEMKETKRLYLWWD